MSRVLLLLSYFTTSQQRAKNGKHQYQGHLIGVNLSMNQKRHEPYIPDILDIFRIYWISTGYTGYTRYTGYLLDILDIPDIYRIYRIIRIFRIFRILGIYGIYSSPRCDLFLLQTDSIDGDFDVGCVKHGEPEKFGGIGRWDVHSCVQLLLVYFLLLCNNDCSR